MKKIISGTTKESVYFFLNFYWPGNLHNLGRFDEMPQFNHKEVILYILETEIIQIDTSGKVRLILPKLSCYDRRPHHVDVLYF